MAAGNDLVSLEPLAACHFATAEDDEAKNLPVSRRGYYHWIPVPCWTRVLDGGRIVSDDVYISAVSHGLLRCE